MIFLVPSFACAAIVAILLFGVFHEGFDSHARVTSITWVDQQSKSGFSWSRQNYFSGLPPNEGLEFGLDTFARPCSLSNSRSYRIIDPRKSVVYSIDVGEEEQRWKNWLRPRQQQQLLVAHPVQDLAIPIQVKQDGKSIEVKNVGEYPIPLLVLRGGGDDYYHITNLPVGATRRARALTADRAGGFSVRDFADYRPEIPPEVGLGGDSLLDFGQRRSSRTRAAASDILHQTMLAYFGEPLRIEQFHFGLIMDENPKIKVPLKAIQTDNLHLMVGEYRW